MCSITRYGILYGIGVFNLTTCQPIPHASIFLLPKMCNAESECPAYPPVISKSVHSYPCLPSQVSHWLESLNQYKSIDYSDDIRALPLVYQTNQTHHYFTPPTRSPNNSKEMHSFCPKRMPSSVLAQLAVMAPTKPMLWRCLSPILSSCHK